MSLFLTLCINMTDSGAIAKLHVRGNHSPGSQAKRGYTQIRK